MEKTQRKNAKLAVKYENGRFSIGVVGVKRPALLFDPMKGSAENRMRAAVEGWKAKIGSIAGQFEGEGSYEALKDWINHIESGAVEWNMGRRTGFDSGIVVEAMLRVAELRLEGPEQAEALIEKYRVKKGLADRDEAVKEWARVKQVAEQVVAIRAERVRREKAVGLDEMMDLLEGALLDPVVLGV